MPDGLARENRNGGGPLCRDRPRRAGGVKGAYGVADAMAYGHPGHHQRDEQGGQDEEAGEVWAPQYRAGRAGVARDREAGTGSRSASCRPMKLQYVLFRQSIQTRHDRQILAAQP